VCITVQVRVLKDIAAGEEVFQSYVDVNLGNCEDLQDGVFISY
jgi:hypothetical protein